MRIIRIWRPHPSALSIFATYLHYPLYIRLHADSPAHFQPKKISIRLHKPIINFKIKHLAGHPSPLRFCSTLRHKPLFARFLGKLHKK